METRSEKTTPWAGILTLCVGLISAALPWAVFFGLEDPVEPGGSSVQIAYYRLAVMGFVLSAVLGGSSLVMRARLHTGRVSGIGAGFGFIGILAGLGLLLILVGLCGPNVLWGVCRP